MFNAIIFVWTVDTASSVNLVFKLGCAELILILLQWAIPEILIRNQRKQSFPSPEAANDPTKVSSITTQVQDSATTPPSQETTTSQDATAQSSDTAQSVPPSNHATDPEHPQTVTETDDPVLTDKSSEN